MPARDAALYHEASETFDPADCDTLDDHISQAVVDVWPPGWDLGIRPRLIKFVLVVVRFLLKNGVELPGLDVRKIEGRELLARLIAEIIDAPNPRVMARSIDFVFELGVCQGMSETKIAELEGVTKAAVSHYCIVLKETHRQGKPARGMKSNNAVESYRDLRLGCSSRQPVSEWPFASTFKQSYAAN